MPNHTLAMVTGASSGIGRCLAEALAARGTDLVLVARNEGRLEEVAEELRGRHGREVDVLVADLEDVEQLATVERRLHEDARIDLLVNNAGYGVTGAFADLPIARTLGQVNCNVVALTRLTHAALATMKPSRRGAIVNIASGAAFLPTPQLATYCATKAYVVHFSLALHEEVRHHGVQVLAVCPGFTRTEFQSRANYDAGALPSFVWQTAEEVARESLAALDGGDTLVVTGLQNRLTMALTNFVPRTWLASMAARFGKTSPH